MSAPVLDAEKRRQIGVRGIAQVQNVSKMKKDVERHLHYIGLLRIRSKRYLLYIIGKLHGTNSSKYYDQFGH